MNYGNPKVLPATGGSAILIGSLNETQSSLVICAIGLSFVAAIIGIRYFWRRKKSLTE